MIPMTYFQMVQNKKEKKKETRLKQLSSSSIPYI